VKLDFDGADEDGNLKETVEELKRKAKEIQRLDNKRVHTTNTASNESKTEQPPVKRVKTAN
jgi:hypothetical protein